MKSITIKIVILAFICMNIYTAHAELWDRGDGLIYDDVLDITWLQDANYAATELTDARRDAIISAVGSVDGHTLGESDFIKSDSEYTGCMTWWGALAWVDQLEYFDSVRGITYDDWRLPQILPVDGLNLNYAMSYDGSTDYGFNISAPGSVYEGSTSSEMAYMYYNNLGNLGYYDIYGNKPQPGWGLSNTGPFYNLHHSYYSSTEDSLPGCALFFYFTSGRQSRAGKGSSTVCAWAVRDGDVGPAVPTLNCTGFEPPFDNVITLKRKNKRAIPVKMMLINDQGDPVTDENISAPPVVNVEYEPSSGVIDENNPELVPPGLADDGNAFRFDPTSEQWIINLSTKQFSSAGTYTVTVEPGDSNYLINTCTQVFTRPE